ncbi:MAG: ABC-F family ATP-binding cassette domain-containing protein [Anaerolineae bacterium]|nr:ABC-F family ATP-binding cassette domain-containing protein [Anaerolineae bacterium]
MALLTVANLARYYGADEVFSGLSFDIHAGECVALVGPNGCGKTTLLDIVVGRLETDAGTVQKAREARLGYLPQVPDLQSHYGNDQEVTLWDAMEVVFGDLHIRRAELRRLESEMASGNADARERAMARYGPLLEAFEHAGGFTYEARIHQVLGGVGFAKDEFQTPITYLSGGEQTRALLARLLLEEPDLLLLDEPTNHLDIEGIEWLEEQFKAWKGAILVVAHDRAFLDAVATRVLELTDRKLTSYRGNYSAYVVQREDRRRQQRAAYEEQQAVFAETEDYVRRYMAGQRTKQAKGRLKRMLREELVERPHEQQTIHVDLQTSLRSGDLVLGLYSLKAGYEQDNVLVQVEEAEIRRGHRVALVGANGTGKTTLLRTILHQIRPLGGRVRIGAAVRLGYFAQIQSHFSPELTLVDTLFNAGMTSLAEVRSLLARYGFRGDDVFKAVGVLSGGERARVALVLLALQKSNFLLLDEPTNHLDIASQEVLQDVIGAFNGTVLLVSHDRYLIRELATQIWAIADNILYVFEEGYAEYEAWHRAYREGTAETRGRENAARARREAERRAQREQQRALARQQEQLAALEAEIHELEARMQTLTAALETAGRAQDIARVTKLGAEYRQIETRLDALLEAWAEAAETPVV